MAKFTDALNRSWELRITVADLPRLRSVGLDLNAAIRDPKKFAPLNDPETVGRVLWVLCEAQADRAAITPEAFAAGFDGPALFAALDAFEEAVTDFSQPPTLASEIKARAPGVRAAQEAKAIRRLDKIISGLNDYAGNSPASPESTPAT